jgi:hypothetical protein
MIKPFNIYGIGYKNWWNILLILKILNSDILIYSFNYLWKHKLFKIIIIIKFIQNIR